MTVDQDASESNSSIRILPDATSSEFYQLHTILSPNSDKLLNYYDQCAVNGEFPFTEQIQSYLDTLYDHRKVLTSRNFSNILCF